MRWGRRIPSGERLGGLFAAGLLAACGPPADRRAPPAGGRDAPGVAAAPAVPPDLLALHTPGGAELWFTLAREDRDSAGTACVERGLEIREGHRRTPVPLLYTREAPHVVNESTVSARLWTHCAAGPEYRVSLRTGQPVRASR
jgi:hypothetical protein